MLYTDLFLSKTDFRRADRHHTNLKSNSTGTACTTLERKKLSLGEKKSVLLKSNAEQEIELFGSQCTKGHHLFHSH